MTKEYIGCCGAYCKTCFAFKDKACKGCKLGYKDGKRNIDRAKCKIKLCCFRDKKLETCADCPDNLSCRELERVHKKYGKRLRRVVDFIRKNGYPSFLKVADTWNGPVGRLESGSGQNSR